MANRALNLCTHTLHNMDLMYLLIDTKLHHKHVSIRRNSFFPLIGDILHDSGKQIETVL